MEAGKGKSIRLMAIVEHFPPYMGSDRTVFELTRQLAIQGVKVRIVALPPLRYLLGRRPKTWHYKQYWTKGPPSVHPNMSAQYLKLPAWLSEIWKAIPIVAYILTVVHLTLRTIKDTLRFSPNLIFSAHASPIVGVVSSLAAKLCRRPLLMGCPDWMTAYAAALVRKSMKSIDLLVVGAIESGIYRMSDHVMAVTDYLRRLLLSLGVPESRLSVIPNGVDTKTFSPEVDATALKQELGLEGQCVVLFIGHLEEWAGLPMLVHLATRLDEQAPGSHLLLVGCGEYSAQLQEALARESVSHMLTHIEYQPHERMPAFVALSDIALCMFPASPVSRAASPLKLFEYMATGKAIVTTDVEGILEVVDSKSALLVSKGDVEAYCEAVVSLCKNPNLRATLGKNA
jgi:glycosyltransferase involved in cell wall biosynthesis